jgi:hypothetical protein
MTGLGVSVVVFIFTGQCIVAGPTIQKKKLNGYLSWEQGQVNAARHVTGCRSTMKRGFTVCQMMRRALRYRCRGVPVRPSVPTRQAQLRENSTEK